METSNYRILLIEDDKLDQMAFRRYIENEKLPYYYKMASSISEAQSLLNSEKFDIIIADYSLGDGTALDILNSAKNTPIVVTTGANDEEVAVKAWRAGAYDYLSKDLGQVYLRAIPKTIENTVRRREIEEALDKKQKNLEAIFDAVPNGMFLIDESLSVTRANDAIRQMFHKEYSQIINRRVGDILGCINIIGNGQNCEYAPACSECLLKKTLRDVLDSEQSVCCLEIHPTLKIDEKEITPWFHISAKPVTINGDRHVIVTIEDVTERKKAEHEHLLAEEKYRMIFENSAAAITFADEQERLISWNSYTEGLLNFDGEELHLKPVQSLYPPEEWERIRTLNIRQKGMQHHLETRMLRKDGSVIDVDISLSILKGAEDEIIGSIGIFYDITERKAVEEKFKETMELKSNFISTVSHDLRTPLAALKEGLGIVLDEVVGEINEKQKKFLEIAARNVDRLGALINDVLDFQKLGADKATLNIQDNNIGQIVSEVHETMALFAQKNKVELVSELPENLPKAKFDRAKITQVLTNLLNNAIKFTPENGMASVNVRHQNEELVISVHDTGIGIPKDELSKIFERFYRVKRAEKQIPGSGLGLAVVHKIVMMHGGRIEVESELDQGTTFNIFLPLNPRMPAAHSTAKKKKSRKNNLENRP
jgi:PAS domain S-box-containing protein